jgi:hypothetical protein
MECRPSGWGMLDRLMKRVCCCWPSDCPAKQPKPCWNWRQAANRDWHNRPGRQQILSIIRMRSAVSEPFPTWRNCSVPSNFHGRNGRFSRTRLGGVRNWCDGLRMGNGSGCGVCRYRTVPAGLPPLCMEGCKEQVLGGEVRLRRVVKGQRCAGKGLPSSCWLWSVLASPGWKSGLSGESRGVAEHLIRFPFWYEPSQITPTFIAPGTLC